MIYLKQVSTIEKNGRVVIKLALGQDKEHNNKKYKIWTKMNKRSIIKVQYK